LETEKLGMF
jgi:cold-inducible RNA-binding protein